MLRRGFCISMVGSSFGLVTASTLTASLGSKSWSSSHLPLAESSNLSPRLRQQFRHCSSSKKGSGSGAEGSSSSRGRAVEEQIPLSTPGGVCIVGRPSGPTAVDPSAMDDVNPAKPAEDGDSPANTRRPLPKEERNASSKTSRSSGAEEGGKKEDRKQDQENDGASTRGLNPGRLFQSNDQYNMFTHSGRPKNVEVKTWKETLLMVGMPAGYPESVRPGYRRFFHLAALGACVAAFAAQIGTQSLLSGFFKGSSAGSWILKDLAPTLISAGIANAITSYGTKAKMWYIVAMALSQGANVIEFCIPHVLSADHFLMAATSTSLLKGSSGLVFGITRATFIQNYAWNHNIGEVTKKTVSIGMVVWTLFGALGLAFAKAVPDPTIQFAVVVVCAFFTTWLTWFNVSHIAFSNLTPVTGRLIMDDFLNHLAKTNSSSATKTAAAALGGEGNGSSDATASGANKQRSPIPNADMLAEELGVMGEPSGERNLCYANLIAVNPPLSSLELGDGKLWEERLKHLSETMRSLDEAEYWAVDEADDEDEDGGAAPSAGSKEAPRRRSAVWPTTRAQEERALPFILGVYKTHRLPNAVTKRLLRTGEGQDGVKNGSQGVHKLVVIFEKDAELLDVLQAMLLASHVTRIASSLSKNKNQQNSSNSSSWSGITKSKSIKLNDAEALKMDTLLKEELQLSRLKYWRNQAVALLAMLKEQDWDVHSQSIDSRNRRFSFKAPASKTKNI